MFWGLQSGLRMRWYHNLNDLKKLFFRPKKFFFAEISTSIFCSFGTPNFDFLEFFEFSSLVEGEESVLGTWECSHRVQHA